MNAQECLKRTAECTRLAEATNDPGLREYLTKLALSWMQSTTTLSGMNACPQTVPSGDGSRQFTTSFSSNVRERPPPFAWRKQLNASSRVKALWFACTPLSFHH
jgi:hypothetical protein